ncbi:polysaccharide pyruvyl transferase family protein [Pseudonocardia sp. T1-2H]|uniref:polysaccharide pyruvyl transferase family protein n=1 Tax=Pseudonocardia sp. T1-2H TaxID=3128899 RepID=UPI00405429B0
MERLQRPFLPGRAMNSPANGAKENVLVSGAYGGFNLGDELILDCIRRQLEGHANLCVVSGNPAHTQEFHGLPSVVGIDLKRGRLRSPEIGRSKSLILGGGELLQEARFGNPFWGLLAECYMLSVHARRANVPIFCWGVGVDDLRTPQGRWMVRRIVQNAQGVTVRDPASFRRLEAYGADTTKVSVTADPVFSRTSMGAAEARWMVEKLGPRYGAYLLCAPAVDMRRSTTAGAIELVRSVNRAAEDRGLQTVLLLMDQRENYEGSLYPLLREISGPNVLVYSQSNIKHLENLVALHKGAAAVVSSRMHSIILAATQGTNVLSVNRSAKMVANAEQLRLLSVPQEDVGRGSRVDELLEVLLATETNAALDSDALAEVRSRASRTPEIFMNVCPC